MGRLIKQQVNRIFESRVKQVTLDLSDRSKVFAIEVTEVFCPNCIWDPVSKASSGKYQAGGPKPFTGKTCPVCKTKGKVDTETKRQVKCNVSWGKAVAAVPATQPILTAAGALPQNMAKLKTDYLNKKVIDAASYFVVDGIRCTKFGEPKPSGLLRYVQYTFYVQIDA
jgi:hypothetical protein